MITAAAPGTSSALAHQVGEVTLWVGLAILIAGTAIALLEAWTTYQTKKEKREKQQPVPESGGSASYAAVPEVVEASAKLADSLSKLDPGTRLLVVGVTLVAIAALAAGIDDISTAIATKTPAPAPTPPISTSR